MSRYPIPINMNESDRQEIERWVSAHRTAQQVAQRCRIVLAAAKGQQDKDIAENMEINVKTVALWRQRFCHEGPDCLWEVAAGRGRKPQIRGREHKENNQRQHWCSAWTKKVKFRRWIARNRDCL